MRKQYYCDTCGKQRNQVMSMGRDSNGDPDAPDMCFFCIKKAERNRAYSFKEKKYISVQHVDYLD